MREKLFSWVEVVKVYAINGDRAFCGVTLFYDI